MGFFNFRVGRFATLLALGTAALYSQGTQTASATITIVDTAGAPVSGARVLLASPSLMSERVGATNESGVFIARLLPPGSYTIEVVKDGFATVRTKPQAIGLQQNYQPRISLSKTGSATVEVVAAPFADVDPVDVKTAANINVARYDTVPTRRIGLDDLAGMAGGVLGSSLIHGGMQSGNLYMLDGQNLMDNVTNTMSYPIIMDGVEEIHVITGGISAEYGNIDGGVINAITKSGGNEFTGLARVDLTNPSWQARYPAGSGAGPGLDLLGKAYIYTLGGFILKDKLWFHISYYTAETVSAISVAPSYIGASVPYPGTPNIGANAQYANETKNIRRQFKLTYMVNQDHTLVATYNNSSSGSTLNNTNAGDINALYPSRTRYEFVNMGWRASWSPNFSTEVRIGGKTQKSAYRLGQGQASYGPIYNEGTNSATGRGFYYNMGPYADDGGDNRNNVTQNYKGTYFLDLHGAHEIDFGLDNYVGDRYSRNEQSPWYNRTIYVAGYRYDTSGADIVPQAMGYYARQWTSSDAKATQQNVGLYINDRWKLNSNLALQIGLRLDSYKAKATDVGSISGSNAFSPRLGASYDLFADQKYIFKASYCRYNGAVMEAVTSSASAAGQPGYIDFMATSELRGDYFELSRIYNPANYPMTAANVRGFSDPAQNIAVNPDLKAPTVDEIQLSATYSFDFQDYGKGYLMLNLNKKSWSNLIDKRVGYNGKVPVRADLSALSINYLGTNYTGTGVYGPSNLYLIYWDNEPDARRDYHGMEMVVSYQWRSLYLYGNISWHQLKGNYEGPNTSASARGIHWFDQYRATEGGPLTYVYDYEKLSPYGYLSNHRPFQVRATADYTINTFIGRTVVGLRYRLNPGARFSHTRNVSPGLLSPLFAVAGSPEQVAFGTGSFTSYEDNLKNAYCGNIQELYDICVTQDFNLFKVYGRQVTLFGKFRIDNALNHRQLLSWNTDMKALPDSLGEYTWDTYPWEPSANYGATNNQRYWSQMRQFEMSAGLRF